MLVSDIRHYARMRKASFLVVAAGLAAALTGGALLVGDAGVHCSTTTDYFPFLSDAPRSFTPSGALMSWLDADGKDAPRGGWDRDGTHEGIVRFQNGPWEVTVIKVPAGGFSVASSTCGGFFP